ncbi:MAG: TniQ family protein [Ramlibacter sp.]|nr:TniQ family protein [Ramlibacter sp.]
MPDELLSSWLVRLAHGHGLKVQTFCNLLFGSKRQVWNRDIDRLAPSWLIKELAARTATPSVVAYGATLRSYEGVLYPRFKLSGVLPWMLPLQMYHRKRQGFGLQFCRECLKGEGVPYFRKIWRVAFSTTCVRHKRTLEDRCGACGESLALHRIDMLEGGRSGQWLLSNCHACGASIFDGKVSKLRAYDQEALAWLHRLTERVSDAASDIAVDVATTRQLCMLLASRYSTVSLQEYVCDQLGVEPLPISSERIAFETRPLSERHHFLQLAGWLQVDLRGRLTRAWRARAVRYSHLLKDFSNAPSAYVQLVEQLSNWRLR